MIKLNKPQVDAKVVFISCIKNRRNYTPTQIDLNTRLIDSLDEVQDGSKTFDSLANKNKYHCFIQHSMVKDVTKDEMIKVYEQGLVKSKLGRKHYDSLIDGAISGICPLCNKRQVSTLDHYLPKAHYPVLAVAPLNLIPSCFECNIKKQDSLIVSENFAPLHPYYDDVDGEEWLYAEIIHDQNILIKYYVKQPLTFSLVMYDRLKLHMSIYKLHELFSIEAAIELNERKFHFKKIRIALGRDLFINYLKSECSSIKKGRNINNSWKVALYRAMYEDDWFIDTYLISDI